MIVAVPLAIMGAIFTACFMRPAMRKVVKPTIEIMEALPTVILGFVAGLWLAPFLENHLPAAFLLFLLMPVGILVFGYAWHRLPKAVKNRVPLGLQALRAFHVGGEEGVVERAVDDLGVVLARGPEGELDLVAALRLEALDERLDGGALKLLATATVAVSACATAALAASSTAVV